MKNIVCNRTEQNSSRIISVCILIYIGTYSIVIKYRYKLILFTFQWKPKIFYQKNLYSDKNINLKRFQKIMNTFVQTLWKICRRKSRKFWFKVFEMS